MFNEEKCEKNNSSSGDLVHLFRQDKQQRRTKRPLTKHWNGISTLDMGGKVVPGSAWVDKTSGRGRFIVFADVDGCNAYKDEVITWSIASSPHYSAALFIADAINKATMSGKDKTLGDAKTRTTKRIRK